MSNEEIMEAIALYLGLETSGLEQVLYYGARIVSDPGFTPLTAGQILDEKEYAYYREKYEDDFSAAGGYEGVVSVLTAVSDKNLVKNPTRLAKLLGLHPYVFGQLQFQEACVWVFPTDPRLQYMLLAKEGQDKIRQEIGEGLYCLVKTRMIPGKCLINQYILALLKELLDCDRKQLVGADSFMAVDLPHWNTWKTDVADFWKRILGQDPSSDEKQAYLQTLMGGLEL